MKIVFATFASIITPAIAITLYIFFLSILQINTVNNSDMHAALSLLPIVFIYGILVSGFHVFTLGLPIVWVLIRLNKLNIWSCVIAGFIAACIPMAIWSWPVDYSYKSSSISWHRTEAVITKTDGIPTLTGWLDYFQGTAFMGIFGIISALSFWWIWRRDKHSKS